MSDVVIIGAKRTAIGSMLGQFTGVPATALGSAAISAALEQSGLGADQVQQVYMGCVLSAGLGQAPARQAAIGAGVPISATCSTISKVCGSGMQAIMFAHDSLKVGHAQFVVAGGMESMTNAPHLVMGSRSGIRFGDGQLLDHMAWDGLTNPYDGKAMGVFGEQCAAKYDMSREEQDAFATASVTRALAAQKAGAIKDEIAAVTVKVRKGDTVFDTDEEPARCDLGKIASLRPAFKSDGTITAASSSKISDGAAALVLTTSAAASAAGLKPIARIVGHIGHAHEPEWFTTAPVHAVRRLLEQISWKVEDVDLFEINEAFACVAMAPMRELGVPHEKLNVFGGACALGHPIGASGARIVVTLLNALRQKGGRRGVASLCIGGGEATALAIELV